MSCNCTKFKSVDEIIKKFEGDASSLIPCLQEIQNLEGYISKDTISKICKGLKTYESEVYGVISFYAQFRTTPPAKYTVEICTGTACYVLGAGAVVDEFSEKLKIKDKETTPDGKWRISTARCLGCCGLAPVVTVNGKVYGKVTKKDVDGILKEYEGDKA